MLTNILAGMYEGNFSFLILVAAIIQIILTLKENTHHGTKRQRKQERIRNRRSA